MSVEDRPWHGQQHGGPSCSPDGVRRGAERPLARALRRRIGLRQAAAGLVAAILAASSTFAAFPLSPGPSAAVAAPEPLGADEESEGEPPPDFGDEGTTIEEAADSGSEGTDPEDADLADPGEEPVAPTPGPGPTPPPASPPAPAAPAVAPTPPPAPTLTEPPLGAPVNPGVQPADQTQAAQPAPATSEAPAPGSPPPSDVGPGPERSAAGPSTGAAKPAPRRKKRHRAAASRPGGAPGTAGRAFVAPDGPAPHTRRAGTTRLTPSIVTAAAASPATSARPAAVSVAGAATVRPGGGTHVAVTVPPGARTHVVRAGESLWSIAAELAGPGASAAKVAALARELWQLNAARIGTGTPDLIHPGVVLQLPA